VLLEVPGRSGLAGSTVDAVARGLGRAQTSSRQPLPGLRPLGLGMEVGLSFFLVDPNLLDLLICCGSANSL
jgi:hypothetical protein